MRTRALFLAATLIGSGTAAAQQPDSAALRMTTTHGFTRGQLDSLPIDSLRTALGFIPGVLPGSRGDLYIRGGRPDGMVTYLDGVPVQPGVRGGGLGASVGPLTPWATGLEQADLTTGPIGAAYGNGTSGLLNLLTRSGGDRWTGSARYSTDELDGKAASFGVNRIEGAFGGPLGAHMRLFAGAYVHGQQSATSGLDGAGAPIYVPAGVDTTLAVPSSYGDPTADTNYVQVANWAMYRGDCSSYTHNSDPGIASNYGATCQGDRIPLSANTSERYQLRLDATPNDRTAVWFSALGGRDQARLFDYTLIQDAQALKGGVTDSRVWTLGLSRGLTPDLRLNAAISLQHDQAQGGPLDPTNELNTRDPFGGLLIAPLKLRWNLSNFPVDDQLILNYRNNIPNSRRSPYDLNNTAQYQYIDQYRNDPYALLGYVEAGGPGGRLDLYDETRVVGRMSAELHSASMGTLTFGVEGTHYNIASYSHDLTSQIFSDVWREKPVAGAAYLTDRLAAGPALIDLGLRFQYFSTGAERPWLLDTTAGSPTVGQYVQFPRTNTYGLNPDESIATFGGKPLLTYRKDPSHTGLSPSLALALPLNEQTLVHAGVARELETPDFAMSFAGINTDLQETNTDQPFGTDIGFLEATMVELGVEHRLSEHWTWTLAAYDRRDLSRPAGHLVNLYDPFLKATQLIGQIISTDGGSTQGAEAVLTGRVGVLSGSVSYAYQHTTYTIPRIFNAVDEGVRPHSLSGIATVVLPRGWHAGTAAGSILGGTSATVLFRYASGARDYTCPATTFVTPGPNSCPAPDPLSLTTDQPVPLPAIKTVDLRLSRSIPLGGRDLSVFIDAHNLFNFANYTSAFGTTAATSDPTEMAEVFQGDSAAFGAEAARNGVYNAGTGSIDLTFGGAADPRTGCGAWTTTAGEPASPNCVYLIRAEERFGNGDGTFTLAEQRRASEAQYLLARGLAAMTDLPRRIRLGIQMDL